jgi:hypothetical protein
VWEMARIVCESVECKMRRVVGVVRYISIFAEEVFDIDNTSWIEIHVYMLEKWK